MSNYLLFAIIIGYLAILFFIAFIAEKNARSKWVNNPYIYTLSLAVYCSAWTYYGSVGVAANSGIEFLTIYLGPVIALPLWIILLRKVLRISRQHKISSIADFISLRYGNHRFLGALVAITCLVATIPYIALQLKAVSETFTIMSSEGSYESSGIYDDSTLYIAIIIAVFAAFFGTQKTDASEKHKGIITTVAFESILKLIFFLIIGIYITFFLFEGTTDIYSQASALDNFHQITTIQGIEAGFNWLFTIALSFFAIFLLPRQFQVSVIENTREKHLKKAIWLFPLYLLLFNIFVIYIAWGGKIELGTDVNADYFALLLPLENGQTFLATLVFLGGLSAVISMVVISTLALSTMVSNNIIIPYGFLAKFSKGESQKNAKYIKSIRRFSIFIIIILAYAFYVGFSVELSLYSIGLIAFVIIAQLGPSFFIGLFWNRGSSKASIIGIIIGLLITFYTLILPFCLEVFTLNQSFSQVGPWGISHLKPYAFFGINFLSPPAHAFFWSLLGNTFCYLIFSVIQKGDYRERNYAELFIDPKNFSALQDSALVWKGEAYVDDIKNVLVKFLGESRTQRALQLFFKKYQLANDTQIADARLINFSEKLLTGSIGNASAKILIAGVTKEEEISLIEVLKILEESKDTITKNKLLKEKSNELSQLANQLGAANEALVIKDKQKDEFLDTVAHELKTPLTGIRAATELLKEDNEMPQNIREQFLENILNDSDRLSRLINNILDFEKLATGRDKILKTKNNLKVTIEKSVNSIKHLAQKKGVNIEIQKLDNAILQYDEDRILQVLTNLLGNALKFTPMINGKIILSCEAKKKWAKVTITDNGKGINLEDIHYIFDKFYQSKNQNTKKPIGSGLGLAISKQIIEKHQGKIYAKKDNKNGATLVFKLPFN